jgi:hypothetical protein
MYRIQVSNEDVPAADGLACHFSFSSNYLARANVWQFLVDNLKPGWRVTLLDAQGKVLEMAVSGDTKKLLGSRG